MKFVELAAIMIVIAMAFVLLVFASVAEAQPQSRLLEVDGEPGMWFPIATARRMLADLGEMPLLRRQITLLEDRLELKVEAIALLAQNIELTEEQAAHWRRALEAALKRADRKPGFFETPSFTFVMGFISAGAFSIAMVYGLDLADGAR